jgi:hypothetical protein
MLPGPAIAVVGIHAERQGGSAPESGSNSGQGNSPDQETAQDTPKPVQPQLSELKLQRMSSPPPAPALQAMKDSPLDASGGVVLAAAPAPVASSTQQRSSSPVAASSVAQISEAPVAAVPLTSKSQVTDVSVNVSIPRQDASPGIVLAAAPAPLASGTQQRSSSPVAANSVVQISEAPVAAVPLASKSQVTDISVNVPIPRQDASPDDRVAIRMVQNGAEIHVSVRTPDTELAQSLRQDLGKLSTGLDQAGFHTETWRPTAANAAAQSNDNPHREPSQGGSNRDGSGQNARSGDQENSGEQRRRQQDDRPRWVAELERQTNQ